MCYHEMHRNFVQSCEGGRLAQPECEKVSSRPRFGHRWLAARSSPTRCIRPDAGTATLRLRRWRPGARLQLNDFTTTNPLIPSDIYRNNSTVDHRDLATFAWLEFISGGRAERRRGPARGAGRATFGSTATPGAGPLVWETYQHRSELFPCNIGTTTNQPAPVPPQPWGAPPTYAVGECRRLRRAPPTACTTITTPGGFNNLDETSEIGQNFLFFPQEAKGIPESGRRRPGAVRGRSGNQVEDRTTSRRITQNLNSTQYPNPFYLISPITLPTGTVEVKAAWRPLLVVIPPSQWYRYHIANVLGFTA